MKYNYIISIFLLILVVIISQAIYIDKKIIIEGLRRRHHKSKATRKAIEAAKLAQQKARSKFLALISKLLNPRQAPYVYLLGQAYVSKPNATNLKAYQEASQIQELAEKTHACKTDADIANIIDSASQILSKGDVENSTKIYYISEVILKGFGNFYGYNIKNNENQFNYLTVQFPKTFKDNDSIQKKYYTFISLLALAHISKSTTSTSLPPDSLEFTSISSPIIDECKTMIEKLNSMYKSYAAKSAAINDQYTTDVT
jgi:hypothetical protein